MAVFDWSTHRPGFSLIGVGAVLWIVGALLMGVPTLAALAGVGAVCITIGQILFWIGLVVLAIEIVIGLFR